MTLHKTIEEIWDDNYVVPLYQRAFAWGEEQITQLIQDVYDSYKAHPDGTYYIGSLVVLRRPDDTFEVIDGQQRLTTLHIVRRILSDNIPCRLTYDSRPDVELFFDGLYQSPSPEQYADDHRHADHGKAYRLYDALDTVLEAKIVTQRRDEGDLTTTLATMDDATRDELGRYLLTHVVLIRTELPADTDVAAYFEIMNNRGEQLQEHEIIKAKMMARLASEHERGVFSRVWDACSQMSVPIQRALADGRERVFGADFNTLSTEALATLATDMPTRAAQTIDDILADTTPTQSADIPLDPVELPYEPIIDFPNFLMHAFKLIEPSVQLNADKMQEEYDKLLDIDAMDFVARLLRLRTLFDRYVVKTVGEDEDDENLKWMLKRPYAARGALKFRNTFSTATTEPDDDESENDEDEQARLVKQESLLQVTFRGKKYKRWLFALLTFLMEQKCPVEEVKAGDLIRFLDQWIIGQYEHLLQTKGDITAKGTDTPHFLFVFIDYLYWLESLAPRHKIPFTKKKFLFNYKYYNSVEHHLPQSYTHTDGAKLDDIGNLCLISKSKNSSLNDKGPLEKANDKQGLMPKRTIMYEMTRREKGWATRQIELHSQDIKKLLAAYRDIINPDR